MELLSRNLNQVGIEAVQELYMKQHFKNMNIIKGKEINYAFDYMFDTHNDISHLVAHTLKQYETTHTVSTEGLEINTDANNTIRTRKHKTKKNRKH
jgi:hypothetical protein